MLHMYKKTTEKKDKNALTHKSFEQTTYKTKYFLYDFFFVNMKKSETVWLHDEGSHICLLKLHFTQKDVKEFKD